MEQRWNATVKYSNVQTVSLWFYPHSKSPLINCWINGHYMLDVWLSNRHRLNSSTDMLLQHSQDNVIQATEAWKIRGNRTDGMMKSDIWRRISLTVVCCDTLLLKLRLILCFFGLTSLQKYACDRRIIEVYVCQKLSEYREVWWHYCKKWCRFFVSHGMTWGGPHFTVLTS